MAFKIRLSKKKEKPPKHSERERPPCTGLGRAELPGAFPALPPALP